MEIFTSTETMVFKKCSIIINIPFDKFVATRNLVQRIYLNFEISVIWNIYAIGHFPLYSQFLSRGTIGNHVTSILHAID